MNRKITEERFNEIKEFLNTPILVKPSVVYVAENFGYSTGTIAQINRFDSYKEYKDWQHQAQKRHIENEMNLLSKEGREARKEIENFNNEWFFRGIK